MQEAWRDVVGFEDRYEVSDLGNVRSKSYIKQGRNRSGLFSVQTKPKLLRPNEIENGYLQVKLYPGKHPALVHRLVATAFIDNPSEKPEVNHKNSIRTDNTRSNLEWVTEVENALHGFEHGLHSHVGSKHPRTGLVESDITEIRRLHAAGMSLAALGRQYNVTYQAISLIVTRKNWSHVP